MTTRLRNAGIATVAAALAASGVVFWVRQPHDAASPEAAVAETRPVAPLNRVWTVENIADLTPVIPPHNDPVPRPIPVLGAYDEALATLAPIVDLQAANPDNAWAIAHGLLARGPDYRIADGRAAISHLFSVYAEPRQAGVLSLVGFPRERAGVPVEPHTDLILKNISEIGLDPGAEFPIAGGTASGADLYRYTLLKTFLVASENKSSFDSPGDMPWGLQALAAWAPPGPLRWRSLDGTEMNLDALTDFLAFALTKESKFMADDMRAGEKFERKGQSLFSYACGGAHLVQGVSYAVGRGYGSADARRAIEAQVPLLLYRLPIELEIYDDAIAKNRQYRKKLTLQRLKFLGHWLETMSKLQIMGFFTPDEMQIQTVEGAAQNLTLTVRDLKQQGVLDDMAAVKAEDAQMYLDVIGDSAHAVRGLELALGRQQLRW